MPETFTEINPVISGQYYTWLIPEQSAQDKTVHSAGHHKHVHVGLAAAVPAADTC